MWILTMRQFISTSICSLLFSLLLLAASSPASAQMKFFRLQKDSIPVFCGFSVSFDLVGAGMLMFSDYGQYEAALRINLHDEWFPIVEAGIGKADRDDEVTLLHYKTSAPYFKIGIDKNLLKDKHGPNRLYVGLRYAFTSYNVDISRPNFADPVWKWDTPFEIKDAPCKLHWAEAVIGIDAKIWGPFHLGWSARYKLRLSHKEGEFGKTWYAPGFGINDTSDLAATFNVIIDI